MRTSRLAIRVARPRNRVVQALVRGLLRVATRAHQAGPRRRVDLDRLDLDQRVREVGEW
jgi:hypothetical protein